MSLERLIKLARRTGDRLIIQDIDSDKHIVILDIDSYEALVDAQMEMLDKMTDEPDEISMYEEPVPVNPFEDNSRPGMFQSTDHDYDFLDEDESEEAEDTENIGPSSELFERKTPDTTKSDTIKPDTIKPDTIKKEQSNGVSAPGWSSAADILKNKFGHNSSKTVDQEIILEELPFDVPFKPEENIGEFNEEKLEDNPVFLEEPI